MIIFQVEDLKKNMQVAFFDDFKIKKEKNKYLKESIADFVPAHLNDKLIGYTCHGMKSNIIIITYCYRKTDVGTGENDRRGNITFLDLSFRHI